MNHVTAPEPVEIATAENVRSWLKYATNVIMRNCPGDVGRSHYPQPSIVNAPDGAYGADEFAVTDPAGTKNFRLFRGSSQSGVSVCIGRYPHIVEVRFFGNYLIDSRVMQAAVALSDEYDEYDGAGEEGDE